jgi:cell division septum initiation protein DivIVA
MNVDAIDAEIGRLRAAVDLISANLIEFEQDPNRELIDGASLQGTSAVRWAEATAELTQIWQWHHRLGTYLDELGKRRGTRPRLSADQENELARYLQSPTIVLSQNEVPVALRPLLTPSMSATHCTADELLDAMSKSYEQARQVLVAIAGAWDMAPRVQRARASLDAARARSTPEARTVLDALQSRVDLLSEALVFDPLSVDLDDVESIQHRIDELDRELHDAAVLRRELDERFAKARTLCDEVERAVAAAEEANREVATKIADPTVPSPAALTASPLPDLAKVELLATQGRWREANDGLRLWSAGADDLLRAALECAAANRAPIEARNELRARLDAFRAMVRRLGLTEDLHLDTLYMQAKDALYTAPTDLVHAGMLVQTYRDAMPRRTTEPEDRRDT